MIIRFDSFPEIKDASIIVGLILLLELFQLKTSLSFSALNALPIARIYIASSNEVFPCAFPPENMLTPGARRKLKDLKIRKLAKLRFVMINEAHFTIRSS